MLSVLHILALLLVMMGLGIVPLSQALRLSTLGLGYNFIFMAQWLTTMVWAVSLLWQGWEIWTLFLPLVHKYI